MNFKKILIDNLLYAGHIIDNNILNINIYKNLKLCQIYIKNEKLHYYHIIFKSNIKLNEDNNNEYVYIPPLFFTFNETIKNNNMYVDYNININDKDPYKLDIQITISNIEFMNDKISFNDIPNEIILNHILPYLNIEECKNIGYLSKKNYNIVNKNKYYQSKINCMILYNHLRFKNMYPNIESYNNSFKYPYDLYELKQKAIINYDNIINHPKSDKIINFTNECQLNNKMFNIIKQIYYLYHPSLKILCNNFNIHYDFNVPLKNNTNIITENTILYKLRKYDKLNIYSVLPLVGQLNDNNNDNNIISIGNYYNHIFSNYDIHTKDKMIYDDIYSQHIHIKKYDKSLKQYIIFELFHVYIIITLINILINMFNSKDVIRYIIIYNNNICLDAKQFNSIEETYKIISIIKKFIFHIKETNTMTIEFMKNLL